MNIFTEASGSLVSAALIKSLKDAGLCVIASDVTERNAGGLLADKYISVPDKDNENLWQTLKELLATNKINWVIPSFDEMLSGWSERDEEFNSEGIKLLISPHKTIDTFLDKWKTYNAFVHSGMPVPKTSLQKKYQMIKPRQGRGSQGITITDKTDVDMKNKISQEVVKGTELTVDCFFDRDGTPIYIVPRIRLKVIDGKSVDAQTIRHEKVEQHIRNMSKKYHFIGPINIQCFEDPDGNVKFTEINPRIAGGMALGFAASENWITLILKNVINGEPISAKPVNYGLRMFRYYDEVFDF